MIKIPKTQYPVVDVIINRWSPRSFKDQPIAHESLMTLFEAAQWAPSSMNEQPWRYLYAHRGTPEFEAMHDCLLSGNQPWTRNAAVLILSLVEKTFERNGQSNRHAMHDVGMANAMLFTQATTMNIYGHMMGGYDPEKTVALFGLSDKQEVACYIALGYRDEADQLEEPFKTRELTPRSRKPLDTAATRFFL